MKQVQDMEQTINRKIINPFKTLLDLMTMGHSYRDGAIMRVMLAGYLIQWLDGYRRYWDSQIGR
jgi:hypothetical protein